MGSKYAIRQKNVRKGNASGRSQNDNRPHADRHVTCYHSHSIHLSAAGSGSLPAEGTAVCLFSPAGRMPEARSDTSFQTGLCSSAASDVFLPETVQVAVLEYGDRLLAAENDFGMRSLAGFEATCEHAFLGDDVNPLNEMLVEHRVIDASHVHDDLVTFECSYGNVLFTSRIGRIWLDDAHRLAAAGKRATAIDGLHYDVAALLAPVKRRSLHKMPLSTSLA